MFNTAYLFLAFFVGIHLSSPFHQSNTTTSTPAQQGTCGCNGRDGRDGIHGIPGRDGPKGNKGEKGEIGDHGLPGEQGTCNESLLDNAVRNLTTQLESLTNRLNKKISDLAVKVNRLENYRACRFARPLGMNSYDIKDSQVSASSVFKYDSITYGAHRARLNYKDWNGWAAQTLDTNQWLQILFVRPTIVTGVATQGYNSGANKEYIKTYQLTFSTDGNNWMLYKENAIVKTFSGNTNSNTVVKHLLMHPVQTLFLRILPKTWHNHISMRMEVYGC